jgi:hypothetical protein
VSPPRRNTQGTLNYNPRIQKLKITYTPAPDATVAKPSAANIEFKYLGTILLKDPKGEPCTGLDPTGVAKFGGLPDVPAATYKGNGFANNTGNDVRTRVSVDGEGLVLNDDGSFWVSDEYGPFVCESFPSRSFFFFFFGFLSFSSFESEGWGAAER